jgi:4-amino-4-deoxy-L-arabinose transferase-like glycosyltransferase
VTDRRVSSADRRATLVDRLALPGLFLLAALLRLPDLATRGTWDGDQGHDMLVLRTLVRDGVVPLLGPPTSIGDVHHGAWYYYILSPAAALTGGDSPLAVVALIAVAGIAAVGVVWWLARSIGGPTAGLVAGLVMATSAAAVDESTFIWNPNLIALSAAIALAAAWRAWSGGDRRWWLVAAVGTAVTMQCHVLGIALLPIVAAPLIDDARRRSLGWVAVGILAIFLAAYTPLLVNELTTDFSELGAATEYLAGGREGSDVAIPVRFGIVGLRVLSWPLTGLITDGFAAGALATLGVIAIVPWRWRAAGHAERSVVRWFGLGLLWSIAFLTLGAPSLAAVVRGLPNDHYHAFADPIVFVLVGLGAAALVREIRAPAGAAAASALVVALVGWNLTHLPPRVHPDGGFPAGDVAAHRVDDALIEADIDRDARLDVRSLPEFKSPEAMLYPLARIGRSYSATLPDGTAAPGSATASTPTIGLVVLCDELFRDAIGADCGGPAEDALAQEVGGVPAHSTIDGFEAAPGRWVSVYGPPNR